MYQFSNEIVFRGHPDKVCDQISDAILDSYLENDKDARCAVEVVGGKGKIFVTGEVSSIYELGDDGTEAIVRGVLKNVGYRGFDKYQVINNVGLQSPDIALGTNDSVGGAGDQGMMFGYARRESGSAMLPIAMLILQRLSREYDVLVHLDDRFLPDGKAQITGTYSDMGELLSIDNFLISYNNVETDRKETDNIITNLITVIVAEMDPSIKIKKITINPTGKFIIGGFVGDSGLTGRKIIVDTYQGFARHGGGAFSGKDPTKVDRSGAYMARYIAKWIREKEDLDEVNVQLSYTIGVPEPTSLCIRPVDITGGVFRSEYPQKLVSMVKETFDLTPAGIIKFLKLKDINYENLAAFGHIGRTDLILPWEKIEI